MSRDFVSWHQPKRSSPHVSPPAACPAISKAFGGASAEVRLGLILAALAAVVLTGPSCGSPKPQAAASGPPLSVGVVKAIQMDVPVHAEWVATLEGYVNAQIQPQVSGYLISQNYKEGSYVHKGDVLFEIDPRPFQAGLDQAKGQLAQARAQLYLADVNVKRDTPLVKERAIAQSQLDTETAAQMQAQAAIQAAEAAVEQAQLNLGFTSVRSLVDGIAGIATTQMGNLVGPATVLTTVSQLDPIKVYFPISEQEYLQFTSRLLKKTSASDLLRASDSKALDLILSDGSTYPRKGQVIFTDRQVDPQTGTIRVVGAFPNPGNILRPGQFGRVRALLGVRQGAVLVPQRCVTELQGTYEVAVVSAQNSISVRKVKVGDRVGSLWVIAEGLAPGEVVVSDGTSKVRDGMPVKPTVETPQREGNR
ncbi:MAG: efflux RND transporter periplasmic adaptor subunit [Acidobacteriia bacterium]|nr:efflux RND transporter periplasmic adaptor subunit [Terriglobia bacterium]